LSSQVNSFLEGTAVFTKTFELSGSVQKKMSHVVQFLSKFSLHNIPF
jgi:hypothetical protein